MVGRHSNQLKTLPVGTRVFIEGPYGALTSQQAHHRSVVLIAGGVGITPLRALFETLPATDITLLYRASSQADLVLTEELSTIARDLHDVVAHNISVIAGLKAGALGPDLVPSGACVAWPPAWRHRDHPPSGQGARAP